MSLMPRPPYSSGTIQPSSPCSPALRQASRLTTPASSHSAVCGTHSFSRNVRTNCRNCSCSSVKIVRRTRSSSGSEGELALRQTPDLAAETGRIKLDYITILAICEAFRDLGERGRLAVALLRVYLKVRQRAGRPGRPGRQPRRAG